MFDSGFLEMLIIGVVALLVVGPERLPGLARKAGHFIGKARAFVNTTKADIEKELQAEEMKSMLSRQKQEISELRDMMQDATQNISKEVAELDDTVSKSVADIKNQDANIQANNINTDIIETDNTQKFELSDHESALLAGNRSDDSKKD